MDTPYQELSDEHMPLTAFGHLAVDKDERRISQRPGARMDVDRMIMGVARGAMTTDEGGSAIFYARAIATIVSFAAFGWAVFVKCLDTGWSLLDCLYYSMATVTTVGYGDITPQVIRGALLTAKPEALC